MIHFFSKQSVVDPYDFVFSQLWWSTMFSIYKTSNHNLFFNIFIFSSSSHDIYSKDILYRRCQSILKRNNNGNNKKSLCSGSRMEPNLHRNAHKINRNECEYSWNWKKAEMKANIPKIERKQKWMWIYLKLKESIIVICVLDSP